MRAHESILSLFRPITMAQFRSAEEWMRERGLTPQQGRMLGYLEANQGTIQRELAEFSQTTPASVTSLLQGLEKRGLVERRADERNARIKRVFATEAGCNLVAGFEDDLGAAEERILAVLNPAEQRTLRGYLERVVEALGPAAEEPQAGPDARPRH